jgi:hypothetical protein|tara:strand:- start:9129 stop:9686 length:558 start_codon:yes stop_codon:yes gene_type:complete
MNYKTLFILGLFLEVLAQILLAQGNEFVYALKPIDFTHWFLLMGVIFMMPQVVNFPTKIFSYIGAPIAIIGIVSMIGMCVLDFVWWSQPTQEIRNEFATHLSKFPSIWKTFITIGPNFLNAGLLILSLNYLKQNKVGVLLIIFATLIIYFGKFIPHRLIYGYLITAIGFSMLFYQKKLTNEYETK